MAAITSRELFNIQLLGREGSYSQIAVVVSTAAIFVILAIMSTFPRLTTWAKHLWLKHGGSVSTSSRCEQLTGIGFPSYPIEDYVGDGALQLHQWQHHTGLCCLTCCRAWQCWADTDIRRGYVYGVTLWYNTLDLPALIIQTRSHTLTKYRPRFSLLCSPDIGWNLITSDLNFHLLPFTSIQWAVTPRNDSFVVWT